MFSNIIKCGVIALLLLLRVIRVSTVPIESENAKFEANKIRQDKAMEMLKYMNTSVDPCDDFYEFTCGNWNTYHSAALTEQPTTGLLELLQESMDNKLKLLLETNDEAVDNNVDRKVKNFYKSCLQLPSLQPIYKEKLKEIASEFGQMPALVGDKWNEQEFDWLQTIARIAYKYGFGIISSIEVILDYADNTQNRLYVTEQDFTLEGKAIYLNKDNAHYIEIFTKRIAANLIVFLGLDLENALEIARELLAFETLLAKGMYDTQSSLQLKDVYELTELDELQQKYYPDLDLRKQINITLGSIPELKIYYSSDYLENLIKSIKVTPKRVVANYIFYNMLAKFMVDIEEDKEKLPNTCLGEMKTYFVKNFDNMIYRKYNSKETEEGIDKMWQDIKLAFEDSLKSGQYEWIKESTRKYALEKLKSMIMEIISYEQHDFETAFGTLQVNENDYLDNLRALLALSAAQNRDAINEPPQPIDFGEKLSNILIENAVKVPVALLQPNFVWSADFSNAFNFGTLGALLSHELIHGFDDTGRNYDAQGNSRSWWDEDSANAFNDRTQCFNNQYQGFVYDGKHLPNMPSQGENIADNGGVRLAYEAYLKWHGNALASKPSDIQESMPGLDFNNRQLFFISYGQLWCGDIHPKYRQFQASTDGHVPDKFRVIGPLSNFEAFAKEFMCPAGSGMNPVMRCEIY